MDLIVEKKYILSKYFVSMIYLLLMFSCENNSKKLSVNNNEYHFNDESIVIDNNINSKYQFDVETELENDNDTIIEQEEKYIIAEIDEIEDLVIIEINDGDNMYLNISSMVKSNHIYLYDSYEIRASNEFGERIQILLYLSKNNDSVLKWNGKFNFKIPIEKQTKTVCFGKRQYTVWTNKEFITRPPFHDMSTVRNDLLYRYDGYWSMRHDEYFKLDD